MEIKKVYELSSLEVNAIFVQHLLDVGFTLAINVNQPNSKDRPISEQEVRINNPAFMDMTTLADYSLCIKLNRRYLEMLLEDWAIRTQKHEAEDEFYISYPNLYTVRITVPVKKVVFMH